MTITNHVLQLISLHEVFSTYMYSEGTLLGTNRLIELYRLLSFKQSIVNCNQCIFQPMVINRIQMIASLFEPLRSDLF